MFEHFTFAACARPDDISNSTTASHSPRDTSFAALASPLPSPLPQIQSLESSSIPSLSPVNVVVHPKPSPITDLTSQLSSQTIKHSDGYNQHVTIAPTSLYSYEFGLPSPSNSASPECHNMNDFEMGMKDDEDSFPVVDDEASSAPPTPIVLFRPLYRSTRVLHAAAVGNGSDSFHTRRLRRQIGARMLCGAKKDRLIEDLQLALDPSIVQPTHSVSPIDSLPSTSSTHTSVNTVMPAISPSLPENIGLDAPLHLDEGFFEDASQSHSGAEEEEALREFTMRTRLSRNLSHDSIDRRCSSPASIYKWRDIRRAVDRNGVGMLDAGAADTTNMVLSRPRMRRTIGRRKREGAQ